MPCRDWDETTQVVEDHTKINELTRMLCGLCRHSPQTWIDLVPGLAVWWKKHQEQDRKREAAEREAKKKKEAREIAELKRLQKKYPKV